MTPTDNSHTISFAEMNRRDRRKFAKQTKMFRDRDRHAWRLMNKTAKVTKDNVTEFIRTDDDEKEEEKCQDLKKAM